jgi:hypothetical protein
MRASGASGSTANGQEGCGMRDPYAEQGLANIQMAFWNGGTPGAENGKG